MLESLFANMCFLKAMLYSRERSTAGQLQGRAAEVLLSRSWEQHVSGVPRPGGQPVRPIANSAEIAGCCGLDLRKASIRSCEKTDSIAQRRRYDQGIVGKQTIAPLHAESVHHYFAR
jgi:hypothetical protein